MMIEYVLQLCTVAMIEVRRDIIPELYQDKIHSMMSNVRFDWHLLNEVTYAYTSEMRSKFPNAQSTPGFAHMFYDRDNIIEDQYWDFIFPLFLSFVGSGQHELLRVKGGLLLPTNIGYNMPHVDAEIPHTTALYYVNDSDGDTHFFSENGEVEQTVKPEKGKLVIFDGLKMHASSCPTLATNRIVINFNYVYQH